jgi:glucosamine kinase
VAVEWVEARIRAVLAAHVAPGVRTGNVPILVVNDARLVLAAHELDSGIALVAGTGSIAIGLLAGREERAGGWGYLLGDEGSGYWVVREALRELCRRHDRHEPIGPLGDVFGVASVPELLARFHEKPSPGQWAALAPAVLDAEDVASSAICASAARHLAGLAASVATTLAHPPPVTVVVAGGLGSGHPRLSAATVGAIHELVPDALVTVASRPSVEGAVRLARVVARGSLTPASLTPASLTTGSLPADSLAADSLAADSHQTEPPEPRTVTPAR